MLIPVQLLMYLVSAQSGIRLAACFVPVLPWELPGRQIFPCLIENLKMILFSPKINLNWFPKFSLLNYIIPRKSVSFCFTLYDFQTFYYLFLAIPFIFSDFHRI